ncbi:MAG: DUF928 domain-containing protein [Deltaproteobacteria bacterium]
MMRFRKTMALQWVCLIGIMIPAMAMGGSESATVPLSDEPVRVNTEKAAQFVVIYSPPLRGMPVNRIGAATRSAVSELPTIMAIVPEHTGLTIQAHPVLYWHLSKPAPCFIELSLIDDSQYEPLWQSRISQPVLAGFHRIRLADTGLKLDTGKTYKWFVAMVMDQDHRSKDVIAGGVIERINPSESLKQKLSKSDPLQRISIFAEEGIWYDTLTTISDLIDTRPGDIAMENIRKDLLTQVGLNIYPEGK